MTDDIVARLRRDLASGLSASIGDTEEAAAEIERLRAALTLIEKSALHGLNHYKGAVAEKIVREVRLLVRDALAKEGKP